MNRVGYGFFCLLVLTTALYAVTPRTVECNFDGANRHRVYSLVSAPGVGTTFLLPDGWAILDFVVTNNKSFFGQSNGTVGVVKPLEADADTSVIIATDGGHCFVFHLTSRPAAEAAALVVVDIHDQEFFRHRLQQAVTAQVREKNDELERQFAARLEQETTAARRSLLFSVDTRYHVRHDHFRIRQTVDDGVFTYVLLPESRERPVVFVGERDKDEELQPVKFTDTGDYYQIHKVLAGKEKFFLKYGEHTTEISRD